MSETTAEPKPTDIITVLQAFDAMRLFLETVWERQGKAPEDIAFVLGCSRWADGSPVDPSRCGKTGSWPFEFVAPLNGK